MNTLLFLTILSLYNLSWALHLQNKVPVTPWCLWLGAKLEQSSKGHMSLLFPAAAPVSQASGSLFAEKCLIAGLGWRRRKDISKTTWLSVQGRQKMRRLDKLITFCSSFLIQPELAPNNKNLWLISVFFPFFFKKQPCHPTGYQPQS